MIPLTPLHSYRVVDQVRDNLVGLQRNMLSNAITHRQMALAQSPPLAILQTFVHDSALEYLRRMQWIIDLRADPVRKQRLIDALARSGITEADVTDVLTPLRLVAVALRDAPLSTYLEIIAACDAVIANVNTPDSLWPE